MAGRNRARDLAVYEARRISGLTYREIGKQFGISSERCRDLVRREFAWHVGNDAELPRGYLPKIETLRIIRTHLQRLRQLEDPSRRYHSPWGYLIKALELGKSHWVSIVKPDEGDIDDLTEFLRRSAMRCDNEQIAREWLEGQDLRDFLRKRVVQGKRGMDAHREYIAQQRERRRQYDELNRAGLNALPFPPNFVYEPRVPMKPLTDEEFSASVEEGPGGFLYVRWKY
jgi:hypothetical protein